MIILEKLDENSNEIQQHKILLIDGHSHLGSDEDGQKNMNPLAPGGTIDFYAKILTKLRNLIEDKELTYELNLEGKNCIYNFKFVPFNFTYLIYDKISELCKCGDHKDLLHKSVNSWIVDQGVVFPFQDVFRNRKADAEYRASNLNISRNTTTFPNSLRLIGYARVTPWQGEKAINEVKFAVEKLGLRGLKLHPRSDGWLDKITEQFVINVLVEAAKHSIPVLFDTRGKKSILDIFEVAQKTRAFLKKGSPELVRHLKVIIGHCAAGNIGDEEVYEAIADDNTIGEISMMHGAACAKFYIGFKNWYNQKYKNKKPWSEHIIFGTDYPYFFEKHAADNISFLISKEFFENGGKIQDTQNILGVNMIRLLPEYSFPQKQEFEVNSQSAYIQNKDNISSTDIVAETLAALIEYKVINPKKLYFIFNQNFYNITEEVMLENSLIRNPQIQSKIISLNLFDNTKMLKILKKDDTFKPFGGYKFFSPEDRIFLHSDISLNNPIHAFNYFKNTLSKIK
ncbi:MAG: amidohydrolase family protein [Candidatus Helarchaeota archaeon]